MFIEDLDEAIMLRNHRRKFEELKMAAEGGSMGDFKVFYNGGCWDVWSIIGADPIRKAIVAECERELAENTAKLGAINVNPSVKLVKAR